MQPGRSRNYALPVILIIVTVFAQVYTVLGTEVQVNCTATRNGGGVNLMCKVPAHLDVLQVSWHRRTKNSYESLVTQNKKFGLNISKQYEDRVSVLQTNDPGTSAIALSRLEEEACFLATFNIYPYGILKGEVCLINIGVRAQVQCNVTRTGGNAHLMCKIPSDKDFILVTWKKRTGNSYETLVTQSKRFGVKISKPYENRLSVLPTKDPGTSVITLSQLEKEDGTCFTATFNLFPDGALEGEVCLPKLPADTDLPTVTLVIIDGKHRWKCLGSSDYPDPQVQWITAEGEDLSRYGRLRITEQSNGRKLVESVLDFDVKANVQVSCHIEGRLNQSGEEQTDYVMVIVAATTQTVIMVTFIIASAVAPYINSISVDGEL